MLKALLPIIEILGRILSDLLIAWASTPKYKAIKPTTPVSDIGIEPDVDDVIDRLFPSGH